MRRLGDAAREAAEDVFFGQIVLIWARWAMIAAAAVLFLWNTGDVGTMTQRVLLLAGLMAVNFFLHGRYLVERPANRALILLASLADVALIAAAVALWGGFTSQLFVLLYPVLFAFALVFPPRFTVGLTVLATALYMGGVAFAGLAWAADLQLVKILLVRLLTLGAVGGLGTYYWRIQRDRRRAALDASALTT
jgi:hypothetical protein